MLLANFDRKEHLQHRAVSLRQHGFLVTFIRTYLEASLQRWYDNFGSLHFLCYIFKRTDKIVVIYHSIDLVDKKQQRQRWPDLPKLLIGLLMSKCKIYLRTRTPLIVNGLSSKKLGYKRVFGLDRFNGKQNGCTAKSFRTHYQIISICILHLHLPVLVRLLETYYRTIYKSHLYCQSLAHRGYPTTMRHTNSC